MPVWYLSKVLLVEHGHHMCAVYTMLSRTNPAQQRGRKRRGMHAVHRLQHIRSDDDCRMLAVPGHPVLRHALQRGQPMREHEGEELLLQHGRAGDPAGDIPDDRGVQRVPRWLL